GGGRSAQTLGVNEPRTMPSRVIQRQATPAELELLANVLRNSATAVRRWKQGVENALVLWAASLLGVVVIWLAAAWVARKVVNAEFGLSSPAAVWLVAVVAPLCGIYAAVSSVRWVRGWKDYRPLLRADIEGAKVQEEHYVFTEAKRFQEPEHGGLIYFLRTTEGKVLTLFDHESQDLGTQERDPLTSSFRPMSALVMVRAPKTGFVVGKSFAGAPLEVGPPVTLDVDPKYWPESESYCSIQWAELESRLGPAVAKVSASKGAPRDAA
ncbi:MAG: hypothetical protein ABUU24_03245, partial [Variovorax sp.]